jgi:hypothetical protein
LNTEECSILVVSFDIQAGHESIILDKVIPIIRKEGL